MSDKWVDFLRYLALIGVYVFGATILANLVLRVRRLAPTRRTLAKIPEYALAWRALSRGEYAEGLDLAWRAYEECRELTAGRRRNALACCEVLLGTALQEAGRHEEALVYLRPAEATLAKAREYDGGIVRGAYGAGVLALAESLSELDDRAEALAATERALHWHVRHGRRRHSMPSYHAALYLHGRELLRSAQVTEAARAARTALEARRATTSDPDVIVALCLALTAEIAVANDRPELALPVAEEAVAHSRMLSAAPAAHRAALAEALTIHARVLGALDRPAEGLAAITESVELTRKLAEELPDRYRSALAARETTMADLASSDNERTR
ncbi:tetratricopeptide (TPR) repeat protein [Hamadaea flava]|uniref:Tetratricopeptide repeat protein n=1 Tax=Hamadaea flava TaxID=1742688 RepID=A0ABV8LM30_9ACTN|nr:hypothetical protein [Hamadaea flava]MCP2323836.1 tetratricopeptide (TPR) repeat protein [Hamadaea flava]